MTVHNSDPYLAVSWDGMHAHDHGLGGKHLWPTVSKYITKSGRNKLSQVDIQYASFVFIRILFFTVISRARSLPTWRKLYHFDKIMDISFSDANKLKDLVKVSISFLDLDLTSWKGILNRRCV